MKSKSTMFFLWLCFGLWGAHRFYVDKTGSGLLFAFTGGFCLIGWLLDFFKLDSMVAEYNAVSEAITNSFNNEFANEIFKQSGIEVKSNPIPTNQYPTKAKRPLNSRMSKGKLKENLVANKEQGELCKRLATINKNIDTKLLPISEIIGIISIGKTTFFTK